jgi:integrase/recombinase XerD
MKPLLTYPCIAKFKTLVELKDFRPNTKQEYVRYLVQLAEHFQCDPATLSEDQVREYFLFLRQHKNYGGSAMTIARASLRCFFQDSQQQIDWTVFKELAIRRVEPLPVVLAREQVARVLGAVRERRFRACLRLIYQCGLRVSVRLISQYLGHESLETTVIWCCSRPLAAPCGRRNDTTPSRGYPRRSATRT